MERQKGSTFVETAVAVTIVACIGGAALSASAMAAHGAGSGAVRAVLQEAAQREMSVARDALKYQDESIAPASVATTLPMPTGSPLPATLSIATSALPHGALQVQIAAVATDGSGERADLTAVLSDRAPLPGTQVHPSELAPAPTGAP